MIRREFLRIVARKILTQKPNWHGWLPGHYSRKTSLIKHLKRFGTAKVACLWKPYTLVTGKEWLAHSQEGSDCVAQAAGGSMDLLTTKQIAIGRKEKWITKSSTDMIYSGGRNFYGDRSTTGMKGIWAVEYLNNYGNLLRKPYTPYDLTPYSEETVRYWDRMGIPKSLLLEAKKHPLLDYTPVKSYPEVRDAIAAGYPVIFCASLGADNSRRDKDGFIKPRGTWYHSWLAAGVDDNYYRPGVCIINSHGPSWASGPKRHNQPDGSVWIDAEHIDYYCKQYGDSYALSNYKGFPKPEESYILW